MIRRGLAGPRTAHLTTAT